MAQKSQVRNINVLKANPDEYNVLRAGVNGKCVL